MGEGGDFSPKKSYSSNFFTSLMDLVTYWIQCKSPKESWIEEPNFSKKIITNYLIVL